MAQSNAAPRTGEEAAEARQSLNQKEALTAQMIGIVSARLNALQVMGTSGCCSPQDERICINNSTLPANNRKLGLECDLRVHSAYCSKLVPGLQDPYEIRAGGAGGKARAGATSTSASTQAMMERLFGPDDKTRSRTVRSEPPTQGSLMSVVEVSDQRGCVTIG